MSEAAAARAQALLDVGRAPEAVALLGAALSQAPESYPLLCLLSRAHAEAGDLVTAARAAEAAIAIEPEEPEAYDLASFALDALGRHRRAIELAEEAVRLAPTMWWTHAGLATAVAHKHDLPFSRRHAHRAMAEARRAIELAPDEPGAHFAMGECASAVNRRREARAAYERVLAVQPDDTAALNNLSAVQLSAGRPFAAVRGFQTVAGGGRHIDLAQHNIDYAGVWLLGSALVGIFVVARVLDFLDEMHVSRSIYSAVAWGALLVIAAAVVFAAVRLPPAARTYYRRLVFHDVWFALPALFIVVACLALFFSALPASDETRTMLRDVGRSAWGLLIVIQIVRWWQRRWSTGRGARMGT